MIRLRLQWDLITENERQLRNGLLAVATRRGNDSEIVEGCKLFSHWCESRLKALPLLARRYGYTRKDPLKFDEALFDGDYEGDYGLLRDLQDLVLLSHQTKEIWITIAQAAKGMKDQLLNEAALGFVDGTDRQIEWLRTQIKHIAIQALTVPTN